ncbi:hypothetical protein DFH07DRAFT_774173 [Mycena maculata]|uniref:Major facilitator superfamily (MFS) profile domain-containing protein n=1 Tax=Mycena maculata TaxID=230809 RepID=A0AAD7IZ68_9AGAR|nr:hypothetical protein DFH07DRAFT_774173 [Mycena maculata]
MCRWRHNGLTTRQTVYETSTCNVGTPRALFSVAAPTANSARITRRVVFLLLARERAINKRTIDQSTLFPATCSQNNTRCDGVQVEVQKHSGSFQRQFAEIGDDVDGIADFPTDRDLLIKKTPTSASESSHTQINESEGLCIEFNPCTDKRLKLFIIFSNFIRLGIAYLLATCTFTPLYGHLCNSMGRRAANQTAGTFAVLGTIACGLSPNMNRLIVARFIAGIGGGEVFATSTPGRQAVSTVSVQTLPSGLQLGMGSGGLFGGLITGGSVQGKSKSTKEVLKRIDYFGTLTLLISVVLAPVMLRQKVPVLVGASNVLADTCSFSVDFFPVWFQVVALESATTAGKFMFLAWERCISMSAGSLFAGWMMHKTGRYTAINLIFSIFPFVGAILISRMREDSGPLQSWLSIMRGSIGVHLRILIVRPRFCLGLATRWFFRPILIHINNFPGLNSFPESQMAVGTGFAQLFHGIGRRRRYLVRPVPGAARRRTAETHPRPRCRGHTQRLIFTMVIFVELRTTDLANSAFKRGDPYPRASGAARARDAYALGLKAVYALIACAALLAYPAPPIPDQDLNRDARRRQGVPVVTGSSAEALCSVGSSAPEEEGGDSASRMMKRTAVVV